MSAEMRVECGRWSVEGRHCLPPSFSALSTQLSAPSSPLPLLHCSHVAELAHLRVRLNTRVFIVLGIGMGAGNARRRLRRLVRHILYAGEPIHVQSAVGCAL